MPLPANVRINVNVPFPALVTSTGPIGLSKVNGVWTIFWNPSVLGVTVPPAGNLPTDYVVVYDSIAQTNFLVALSSFAGLVRPQRLVQSIADLPVRTADYQLNFKLSAPLVITLPLAATRANVPLTLKDVAGNFNVNNLTLNTTGGDTIDGAASGVLKLQNARQDITLVPAADGTTTGWLII